MIKKVNYLETPLMIGQIIFFTTVGQIETAYQRKAIYEIEPAETLEETVYQWVNLDTPEKGMIKHIEILSYNKLFSTAFKTGHYCREGDTATTAEIIEALQKING